MTDLCSDGASDTSPKTPGGIGTPDAGSLVEHIHINFVCLYALGFFFSSLVIRVRRVDSQRGWGYRNPWKVLHSHINLKILHMEGIYHDPDNPQLDAVERYRLFPKRGERERSEVYSLYFLRSQLMADVLFQLRIITRGRRKDGEQDNSLELTDDLRYQFSRWMDIYISRSKKPLSRYLVEEKVHGVTDVVSDSDEIEIRFKIGDWWNESVLNLLMLKIHDYVVNGLMYEYLMLYFGSNDSVVQGKEKGLLILLDEIKNLMLSYKAGSVKKQFHPFP